jgi:hypothetical protein
VPCAGAFLHHSCTCTGQTALQAPYSCKETSTARYSLYVPVPALSSLLFGALNGASALLCLVVCLPGLSGGPLGLSLAVNPLCPPIVFFPSQCPVLQHPLLLPLVPLLYRLPYPFFYPLLSCSGWSVSGLSLSLSDSKLCSNCCASVLNLSS